MRIVISKGIGGCQRIEWASLVGCLAIALAGCSGTPVAPERQGGAAPVVRAPVVESKPRPPSRPQAPPRTPEEHYARVLELAERLLPPDLRDRSGWAGDIATSMTALSIPALPRKVCAVAAVIEQESGWRADPVVPDLGGIARREMERKLGRYLIPGAVLDLALRKTSSNGQTYAERIAHLRTERELSELYDEMISEVPQGPRLFGDMNPVHTGGPMQVSVAFAEQTMRERRYPWRNAGSAREEVFSRRGGVYFGTAMLLDYPVSYNRMLYRFADFNAGRYASRNAAFQRLVAALTRIDLAPDGDLLRYADGKPAGTSQTERAVRAVEGLGMDERAIRRDLLQEKSFAFERTKLYRRVRELAERRGLPTPEASVPDIALESPKITRKLTTRWFAERVEGRYRRCLARNHED
ncbi:DUF1615 domain-containing protein [Thiorhodococcus fuscus]|uniref:DUF1615 domain-containing protein n=1 Tax=Thiorhodococcus fuscus TaxID=527200 RepID=A0ABW4YAW3_9GAMM